MIASLENGRSFCLDSLGSKASHIHFIYAPLHIRASAKQQIVARGTHLTVERAGSCLMSWCKINSNHSK